MKISRSEGCGGPNLSRVAHKVKHRVSHPARACKTLTGFAQAMPDAKPLHNLSTTPLAASVGLRPPAVALSASAVGELPPLLSFLSERKNLIFSFFGKREIIKVGG